MAESIRNPNVDYQIVPDLMKKTGGGPMSTLMNIKFDGASVIRVSNRWLKDITKDGYVYKADDFTVKPPNDRASELSIIQVAMENVSLTTQKIFTDNIALGREMSVDMYIHLVKNMSYEVQELEEYYLHGSVKFSTQYLTFQLSQKE